MPKLQTPRLALEALEPRHADHLFDDLCDESLYAFIDAVPPESVDSLRERYTRLAKRRSPDGTQAWLNWAIWSALDERYIGFVQATVTSDQTAEIAYVLFREFHGNGYAREAVRGMLAHLVACHFVSIFRACVDPRNLRSIALLEALGFALKDQRISAAQIRGEVADEFEYVLVADRVKPA